MGAAAVENKATADGTGVGSAGAGRPLLKKLSASPPPVGGCTRRMTPLLVTGALMPLPATNESVAGILDATVGKDAAADETAAASTNSLNSEGGGAEGDGRAGASSTKKAEVR